MKAATWILGLSLLVVAAERTAGAWAALASLCLLAALRLLYFLSARVRTRLAGVGKRARAEASDPHPLVIAGISLLGTVVVVHFSSIWNLAADVLTRPAAGEKELDRQIGWLQDAVGSESFYIPSEPQTTFKEEYAQFDLDTVHAPQGPKPVVGVEEFIDRKFELMDREVTVIGDLASVVNFRDRLVGLWIWDTDEHRNAEASCAVKVKNPKEFIEGRRIRIEGLSLLFATNSAGTEYSRPIVGFACARADVFPYSDWSPEEIVNEYIDDLQNSDGWRGDLENSRTYWIDHYADFRLDRAHSYLSNVDFKQSPIRRLIWGKASFDGHPVLTWGWVESTSDRVELINGRRYVRQLVSIEDDKDSSSTARCDLLRRPQHRLHEGDWVNAIGLVLGTETIPFSTGGFQNGARMICAAVRRVGS